MNDRMECSGSAKKHYVTSTTIHGRTVCSSKEGATTAQFNTQVHTENDKCNQALFFTLLQIAYKIPFIRARFQEKH